MLRKKNSNPPNVDNEEFLTGTQFPEIPLGHLNLAHLCGERGIGTWYLCRAKQLALEFSSFSETPIVREMKAKLLEKFASVDHAGPVDVANFRDLSDEQEINMIRRDAFEQVQALLSSI
jgi:hypothetical protein